MAGSVSRILVWVRCWEFWTLAENTPVSAGPANTSRIVSLTVAKASARGQYSSYNEREKQPFLTENYKKFVSLKILKPAKTPIFPEHYHFILLRYIFPRLIVLLSCERSVCCLKSKFIIYRQVFLGSTILKESFKKMSKI